MPAMLSSSDHLTPRSTLRHRPIDPFVAKSEAPRVPRASRTSTPQKRVAPITTAGDIPAWKHAGATSRSHPRPERMGFVGIGMLVAVALFLLGQWLIGWTGTTWDDLHYGRPRTYQVDAVVGQSDSVAHPSHFIALNLKGQVEIIELPGGDASHAKIYLGPRLYGPHADLVPVTLQFVDRRHDHHPDMLVLFQQTQAIFHNEQGTFQPSSSPGS
jgi:hypothetical protein